jgi:hypothetical protein
MMIMEIHYHGLRIHPPPHLPIPLHSRFLVLFSLLFWHATQTTVKSTKWYKRVYRIFGHIIIMMIIDDDNNNNCKSQHTIELSLPQFLIKGHVQ